MIMIFLFQKKRGYAILSFDRLFSVLASSYCKIIVVFYREMYFFTFLLFCFELSCDKFGVCRRQTFIDLFLCLICMIYQSYNENEITLILVENIYMNCYAGQVTIANIKTCIYLINKIHFQISMLLSNIQERNLQIIQDLFLVLYIPCLNIIVNLIFALLINQYFF